MGHQLESGRETMGAAILSAAVDGVDGYPEVAKHSHAQKPLRFPRHLTRVTASMDFANPTERDLARIFSFYQIDWVYEPTMFHLGSDNEGRPTEQVCPDFYLPDHDVYVELTTMRQSLVTRKNRKIRRLKEAFPTVQIRLLYRKDYDRLMGSVFGVNGHAVAPVPGKPIISDRQLQHRITALATEIGSCRATGRATLTEWRRHAGADRYITAVTRTAKRNDPVRLIGLGAGARQFTEALEAELAGAGIGVESDMLALTKPSTSSDDRVRVSRKPERPLDGTDVVLVADVVSTGLSANFASDWLRQHGARSVRVCTLFDRCDARILDVPVDWSGFLAPDALLVGYGISYQDQFDDLPTISPLRAPVRSRKPKPEADSQPR